jgi:outer membrane protein assembly factor BamB
MERILFVVALCALCFGYGVATMQFEVFPYPLLKEAKLGWEAWASMDTQKRNFPQAFERFEPAAAATPQARRLLEGAGEERVLVTGGPYQLLERCPTWGCMAWISDRTGKVLHTWEVNLDELWSGLSGVSGDVNRLSLYPVGMALGDDGSLIVSFQGRETYPVHIGIIKLDRNGRILWKRFDRSHHWPAMDAGGRIYTPASAARDMKHVGSSRVGIKCATGASGVDSIRVLSPEGEPLREMPLLESFVRSGYAGLFYGIRDGCNPTHLNSVALADPEVAKAIPGAAAGDLLVSLRETSAVALLDGKTAAVKYLVSGRSAAQHAAQFLPDGSVLALDNLGGERSLGGTRVVRINLVTGAAQTVFPKGGEQRLLPVQTETAGQISVSSDGKRALVAVTHQGRIIEIDVASGAPLWVYDNTHDIGPFLEAADIRSDTTRARFATYGAYYVQGNMP